jgi:hypothetical protein
MNIKKLPIPYMYNEGTDRQTLSQDRMCHVYTWSSINTPDWNMEMPDECLVTVTPDLHMETPDTGKYLVNKYLVNTNTLPNAKRTRAGTVTGTHIFCQLELENNPRRAY